MYISLITKEYVNGRVAITTDRIGGFRTGHGTTPDNFWSSLLKWAGQKTSKENVHVGFIKSTETYYENYVESIDGVTYQEIDTEYLTTFGTDEFDVVYFISLPKTYNDGIPDLLEDYVKEGGGLIFESPDEEGEIALLSSIDSIIVSSTQRPNYDTAYWTTTGFNSELYTANFTSSFMVTIGQDLIPSDWSILLSNIETIVIPVEDDDVLNQFDYDNKDIVEFGMSFVVGMKDGLVTLNEGDNILFSTSSSLSSSSSSTELETEWDFCSNILGYWKLNEDNANSFLWDSSGDFSQIATLRANGSAVDTSILSTTGKVNNAISFSSGSQNNATVAAGTKLNFTDGISDTPFSIVFWVKPSTVSGVQVLLTKDGVWEIGLGNDDLIVTLINGVNTRTRFSNSPIKSNQWNFVTVTYDGLDIKIYVKNIDVSTTQIDSGYTSMADVSSITYFGSDSTASWFSGILDNVLIVDKVVNSIEREGMWNMGRGTEDCSAVLQYTSSSDSSSSSIDSSSSSSGGQSESSSSSLGYSESLSSSSLGYSESSSSSSLGYSESSSSSEKYSESSSSFGYSESSSSSSSSSLGNSESSSSSLGYSESSSSGGNSESSSSSELYSESSPSSGGNSESSSSFGYSESSSSSEMYSESSSSSEMYSESSSSSEMYSESSSSINDGCFVEVQEITGSGDANGLGGSMAIYNNTLVLGASLADDPVSNIGAAYVYDWNGSSWSETQKLTASDGGSSEFFGSAVAIHGNRIVVGAYGVNGSEGAAYIFEWNGFTWSETQKISASDATSGDNFGHGSQSIGVFNDTIVVGAWVEGGGRGSAYIFEHNGVSWSETQIFRGDSGDTFGTSVGITEDWIAVGSRSDDDPVLNAGQVVMYDYNGTSWILNQTISPSSPVIGGVFGSTLSLQNNRMAVGAGGANEVYVFDYSGATWSESQKIVGPSSFGFHVSLGDNRISTCDGSTTYIYDLINTNWFLTQTINDSDISSRTLTKGDWLFGGDTNIDFVHFFECEGIREKSSSSTSSELYSESSSSFGYSESSSSSELYSESSSSFNDGCFEQKQQIHSTTPAFQNFLGRSVSLDNNRFATGANGANEVLVFDWNGSLWSETQTISGPAVNFGVSVSLHKNRIAVGSNFNRFYIYDWTGATWSLTQDIAVGLAGFGQNVSIYEDRVITNTQAGQVWIYDWNGSTWVNSSSLVSVGIILKQSLFEDRFVALSGGDLKVYDWTGATWSLTQTLTDATGWGGVALHKDRIIAFDGSDDKIYVYDLSGTWSLTQTITHPVSSIFSLSLHDDIFSVGNSSVLGTYVYKLNGGHWAISDILQIASATHVSDTSIQEGILIAGAHEENATFNQEGAVYYFECEGVREYSSSSTSEGYSESSSSENYSESSSSSENYSESSSVSEEFLCDILESKNEYLAAYWPMEESSGTRVDVINSINLNENGSTVSSGTGKKDDAAFFPDSLGPTDNLQGFSSAVGATSSVAISTWIKLENQTTGGNTTYQYGRLDEYYFRITNHSSGGFLASFGIKQSDLTVVSSPDFSISSGVFHNLVGIADGSTVAFYIDNELVWTETYDGTIQENSGLVYVPTVSNVSGTCDHYSDEFAIWVDPTFIDKSERNIFVESLWNKGNGSFWNKNISNWDICIPYESSDSSSSSEAHSESSSSSGP